MHHRPPPPGAPAPVLTCRGSDAFTHGHAWHASCSIAARLPRGSSDATDARSRVSATTDTPLAAVDVPVPPEPGRARRARPLVIAARVVVSGVLVWLLLSRTELRDVGAAFRSASPLPLVYAFLLNFVGYFLSVSRWRLLLAAQGVAASRLALTGSHMTAIFFNNLLPSIIGGDAMRIYDSWKLGATRTAAVAVIAMDRLTGMVAILLCAVAAILVSGILAGSTSWTLAGAFLLVAAAGVGIALLAHSADRIARVSMRLRRSYRLRATLDRFGAAFQAFSGTPRTIARAFGLSVLLQINVIAFYALIASAFDLGVPLYAFFLIIPPALAAMMLPISINAIGIRENAFAYLLGVYGVAAADAVAFAWAAFGIVLIHGVMGGVVYALRR